MDSPSAPADDISGAGFYADDVEFRSGVVSDQAPVLISYAAAVNGYRPPPPQGSFCYADLGCGDGTTLCALAAVNPDARFVGVDFNPGHIRRGRERADELGLANVRFVETSFAALSDHDLPVFDFVAMNGVYAWLPPKILDAVHGFLRRHLRPGGLFYVEYTSLPGKASVTPLWHLIRTLVPDRQQSSRERAAEAIQLLGDLVTRGMGYLSAHGPAARAARTYFTGVRHDPYKVDHFAHNALASGFQPRYFTQMADEMGAIGLAYAGRTALALNDLELSVPSEHVPYLKSLPDPLRRELLKDYIRNEQLRRDVFIMHGERDPVAARAFLSHQVRYLGKLPKNRIKRRAPVGRQRTVSLTGPAYDRLIQAFDEDARSLAEVLEASDAAEPFQRAAWRLMVSNQYFLCIAGGARAASLTRAGRVRIPLAANALLLRQAVTRLDSATLVSTLTGGAAVRLGPLEAKLLAAAVDHGFAQAVQRTHKDVSQDTRSLNTTKGPVPVSSIRREKLAQMLRTLRERQLHGMLRLGIVEPVAETP